MTLHVQETTATVLTAALASKTSELSSSRASNDTLFEQGSSSTTDVPSSSTENPFHDVETRPLVTSELIRENRGSEPRAEMNTKLSLEASSQLIQAKELGTSKDEHSATSTEITKRLPSPVTVDLDSSAVESKSFSVGDGYPAPEEIINLKDHGSVVSQGSSGIIACDDENVIEDKKTDVLDNSTHVSTSNDVYLNIRLPDGMSLQGKFSIRSTLAMVKDYVDINQTNGIGSYDLAIPYPRKVFNEQDFSKELSELGLFNRQAMIVVPRHPAAGFHRGRSLSPEQTIPASDVDVSRANNGGYFDYLKRALSYMNPFYYLGSSASASNSEQEPKDGSWQYRPTPARQTERPFPSYSQNHSTSSTAGNASKSRKSTTSQFGSNIHTLKHDEDEDQFKDRNTFWNGNSTQYGGDDGK
ncbi:hypothetical protein HHK36_020112 [Tetracentron sinense]|uniref:UBX domain-containing protein n=1 Tax=Tetracentron sinense TaxID=13715 RepID=A0A834YT18_TETSI|nr:hypothetical protein HHK36_020112 [Tetracentron sinense]